MKFLHTLILLILLVLSVPAQEVLVYKHSIYWIDTNKVIFLTQYTNIKTSRNIISYLLADCQHANFVVMEQYHFVLMTNKLVTIKPTNKIQIATLGSPERQAMKYVCNWEHD